MSGWSDQGRSMIGKLYGGNDLWKRCFESGVKERMGDRRWKWWRWWKQWSGMTKEGRNWEMWMRLAEWFRKFFFGQQKSTHWYVLSQRGLKNHFFHTHYLTTNEPLDVIVLLCYSFNACFNPAFSCHTNKPVDWLIDWLVGWLIFTPYARNVCLQQERKCVQTSLTALSITA